MLKIVNKLVNKSPGLLFSNNTLKINLSNKFLKIGFRHPGSLKIVNEYDHFQSLQGTRLASLVPKMALRNRLGIYTLEIEKLNPLNGNLEYLRKVYDGFNDDSWKEELGVRIIPFLMKNIELVEVHHLLKTYRGRIVNVGPVHGDLHLGNIMFDSAGELKIIDLDLYMPEWNREFDLINFLISECMLQDNLSWLDAAKKAWRNSVRLSIVDKQWEVKDEQEKKLLFYLYCLKRFVDEKQVITEQLHKELIGWLQMEL